MNMKKIIAFFLTLCMMLISVVGCSKTKPTQPIDSKELRYKDTIILATAIDQNYMDGQMNNTNDKVLRTVYSSLVKRNCDNEIVGDLAEHWEVSNDKLTWTFYLKKGVKFHNGKEFTAKDVKASYDRLLNAEEPVRYTSTMSFIKKCRIVDDYTIELYTEKPSPSMLANLCHRANLILDADYIKKYGKNLGLTAESCNGTGPYKLIKWNINEQMVFESFDYYFEGKAPSKKFIIRIIPEAHSRAIALEAGEVDISDGVASEDIFRLMELDGISVNFYPSLGLHGFQFNCAHPIIKNTKTRQAISYAIDREAIIEKLYAPLGEYCATAPLSEVVWGYYDFGVIKQDKKKAKQLMAEAGYPNGFSFSIQVFKNYNKAFESAEMIVSDLAEIGIIATIEVVDKATFEASMTNKTYLGQNFPWGMFAMGYGPSSLDADEGLRRIWATSKTGDNYNNYGWYSNLEVDKLLEAATVEMNEETRKDLYKQAMQIIYIDDPAAVFTNQRRLIYCMSDKVEGFQVDMRNAIDYTTLKCRADL